MQRFLARQPIFNSARVVYGYELLFRSGPENRYSAVHHDMAAASTVDSILLFGIERLTPGCRSFLNCTRDFLVRDFATMLPSDRVVLEMLETVTMDEEVLAACRAPEASRLSAGARRFHGPARIGSRWWRWRTSSRWTCWRPRPPISCGWRRLLPMNIRMLAEKVETYEDFHRTRGWGYTYFQGYFFSRPEMLSRRDVPSNQMNYLLVLQAVNRAPMDIAEVSQRIKAEASLSFRLLRYLNSPAFPLIVEVRSIPHALSLLGERGTRKWVSLIAVTCMAGDKPAELVALPLIRARFCELLAPSAGLAQSANDLFLLGLLSAMDAILDMRMPDVLKEIAIGDEIRDALLGNTNRLREIFDFVLNYEQGRWDEIGPSAARLGIREDAIPALYMEAVEWAGRMLSGAEETVSSPAGGGEPASRERAS